MYVCCLFTLSKLDQEPAFGPSGVIDRLRFVRLPNPLFQLRRLGFAMPSAA